MRQLCIFLCISVFIAIGINVVPRVVESGFPVIWLAGFDTSQAKQLAGDHSSSPVSLIESYDFGQLSKGQDAEARISLVNNDVHPWTITDVQPECGCTVVRPSSRTIGARDAVSVSVTVDTDGREGHFRKRIRFRLRSSRTDETVEKSVALKGVIGAGLVLTALPNVVDLGKVGEGVESVDATLHVIGDESVVAAVPSELSVELGAADPVLVQYDSLSAKRATKKVALRVAISKMTPSDGRIDDEILLTALGRNLERHDLKVRFVGQVVGRFSAEPARVLLKANPEGEPATVSLNIAPSATSDEEFRIDDVTTNLPFHVSFSTGFATSQRIDLVESRDHAEEESVSVGSIDIQIGAQLITVPAVFVP